MGRERYARPRDEAADLTEKAFSNLLAKIEKEHYATKREGRIFDWSSIMI